jgi:uncharacterized protein (TIGR03437 family)
MQMKRIALLVFFGVSIVHGQAVVDGFTLDQVSFAAAYSGNVPCSEYGQASYALRQFPGIVQYVQVVAQMAGSSTAPAWIVRNVPAVGAMITASTDVNLTLVGVSRGTCITGTQINYAISVTNNPITIAPSFTGAMPTFARQMTNSAEGLLPFTSYTPGNLPPLTPTEEPIAPIAYPDTTSASSTTGDVNASFIPRIGMGDIVQGPSQCGPGAVTNSMQWLQSAGSINLNGESAQQTLAKLNTDMSYTAPGGTAPSGVSLQNLVKGKLTYAADPAHALNLDIHYQAASAVTGLGASVTASGGTAARSGSDGPPTPEFIRQEMLKGQDVEMSYQYMNATGTPIGGHTQAVSGSYKGASGQGVFINDDTLQNGTIDGLRDSHYEDFQTYTDSNGLKYVRLGTVSIPTRVTAVTAESPKPTYYLYVTYENSNSSNGYRIMPIPPIIGGNSEPLRPLTTVSGGLSAVPGSPAPAGNEPVAAVDVLGKFLYVVNYGSSNLSAYTVNQSTGALTAIAGSPFAVGSGPFSAAGTPSGRYFYVSNYNDSTISAFVVDPPTGALAPVPGSPFGTGGSPAGTAISPSGRLLFTANSGGVSVHVIDPTTGALSQLSGSPSATGSGPNSVAIDPTGRFVYVVNAAFGTTNGSVSAFSVGATGSLTPVPGSPFKAGTQPDYIVVDSTGQFAYVSNYVSGNVSAFTIDSTTGALTQVSGSPYTAGPGAFAVATDSDSQFVYVSYQGASPGGVAAFAINSSSGALTAIAGSPFASGSAPTRLTVTTVWPNVGPANPVPVISQLAPSATATGSGQVLLSVIGQNFVPQSVVRWNGASLASTYISANRIDVAVPARNLAAAATPAVTVVNPAPTGGTSNSVTFTVAAIVNVPAVPGNGTVNNGGYTGGMAVAPGSIAASFGAALASGSNVFTGTPPTTLGGTSVTFNGTTAAPLFFTSTGQINMQIPWETAGAEQSYATFSAAGGTSSPVTVPIAPFAPGIFALNAAGQGAIVISTGEVAAPVGSIPGLTTKPTTTGDYLTIYCTGLGDVSNRPATGAATPLSPYSQTMASPTVTIGGVSASVSFSGLTPTAVGLYQINVQVPSGIPAGAAVPVVVSIRGQRSNSTTIAVQ